MFDRELDDVADWCEVHGAEVDRDPHVVECTWDRQRIRLEDSGDVRIDPGDLRYRVDGDEIRLTHPVTRMVDQVGTGDRLVFRGARESHRFQLSVGDRP